MLMASPTTRGKSLAVARTVTAKRAVNPRKSYERPQAARCRCVRPGQTLGDMFADQDAFNSWLSKAFKKITKVPLSSVTAPITGAIGTAIGGPAGGAIGGMIGQAISGGGGSQPSPVYAPQPTINPFPNQPGGFDIGRLFSDVWQTASRAIEDERRRRDATPPAQTQQSLDPKLLMIGGGVLIVAMLALSRK